MSIESHQELARPFFDVKLLTPPETFLADVTFFHHGGLLGSKVQFSDQRLSRKPGRITEFETEFLLIETYLHGSCRGLVGDDATHVEPGIVHIIDWSRDYKAVMRGMSGIGLHVPHAAVGYDPSVHPGYLSFSTRTPYGRLLKLSLELLIDEMAKTSSREPEMMAPALLGLVRNLFAGGADWQRDPESNGGRRAVIAEYIRRKIGDFELSAERICGDLGMSRATLYRAFGAGGVEHFIRDERLQRCFDDLLGAETTRGTVNRVAEHWGFYDPSNFRRSFRARFGVSPSDCLGEVSSRRQLVQEVHPVHRWLRKSTA